MKNHHQNVGFEIRLSDINLLNNLCRKVGLTRVGSRKLEGT